MLRETFDDLLDAVCADIHLQANGCTREFGDFQFLISPTDFSHRVITRLMIDPHYRDLPWPKTRVWLADDAAVANNDGQSEDFVAIAELMGHAGLPAEQMHGFHAGNSDSQSPDEHYEKLLRETLGWREKGQDRPDFALLSLGVDGGVAGLSAEDLEISSPDRLAIQSLGGAPRVTTSLALLNATRFIAVLASGDDLRGPVQRVVDADRSVPASGLEPLGGELRWYVDHAACPAPDTEKPEESR